MNSICEDIKDMIEANPDLGLTFAVNLFIRQAPMEPMNIVTIFDTSSGNTQATLNDVDIHNNSFQLIIQNQNYQDAYELASKLEVYLQSIHNEAWNGTQYMLIKLMSGPSQLAGGGGVSILQTGRKRGQVEVSMNFVVKRMKV